MDRGAFSASASTEEPDEIDIIFKTLIERTMRKGGKVKINRKDRRRNAFYEICFHEFILKCYNMEEKWGSIMPFHPEYVPNDKEIAQQRSIKEECALQYDYFKSLSLRDAISLVNIVRGILDKSLVNMKYEID